MNRFKEPTRQEEDWQTVVEQVHEELSEELGREPTDVELNARLDYYESEADNMLDMMIDEAELIEFEDNE